MGLATQHTPLWALPPNSDPAELGVGKGAAKPPVAMYLLGSLGMLAMVTAGMGS